MPGRLKTETATEQRGEALDSVLARIGGTVWKERRRRHFVGEILVVLTVPKATGHVRAQTAAAEGVHRSPIDREPPSSAVDSTTRAVSVHFETETRGTGPAP